MVSETGKCCWPSFQSVRSVILCKRNATACTRVIRATNHAIWDATKRYSCFDARSSMPLPASALSTPRHRKGVGEWPARKRCTQAHACILHANAAARRSSAPHPGRGCDKQLDPRMPWHATALASPLTAPAPHGLGNGRRDEGHACICSKGRGEIFEGPRWATHAARRSIQRPCRSPPPEERGAREARQRAPLQEPSTMPPYATAVHATREWPNACAEAPI